MTADELVKVFCQLSRGGFSDERVFRVALANGETHIGAALVEYCYTSEGQPLGDDQPEKGKPIKGLLDAWVVQTRADDQVLVSVPDGSVLVVKKSQIARATEGSPRVSIKP